MSGPTHYVYTITSEGRPIYVGCAMWVDTRLKQHKGAWMRDYRDVAWTVEGPYEREDAFRREARKIHELRPERNWMHNPDAPRDFYMVSARVEARKWERFEADANASGRTFSEQINWLIDRYLADHERTAA